MAMDCEIYCASSLLRWVGRLLAPGHAYPAPLPHLFIIILYRMIICIASHPHFVMDALTEPPDAAQDNAPHTSSVPRGLDASMSHVKRRRGDASVSHAGPVGHSSSAVGSRRRGNTDTVKLLMLGYRQELAREFTLFNCFGANVNALSSPTALAGSYGIGIGFTYGGPVVMIWGWIFVLLMNLSVSLSLAEMASAYPTSGALYYWSYKMAAPRTRNVVCFVTAWLVFLGQAALSASAIFTFVELANAMIIQQYGMIMSPVRELCVLMVTLVVLLLLNSGSARLTALLTTMGTLWHILAQLAFCVVLLVVAPTRQSAKYIFTKWYSDPEGTGISNPVYTIMQGVLMAQWQFTGMDGSAHVSEETVGAEHNVPIAILLSSLGSGLAGFLFMITMVVVKVDDSIVFDPTNNMVLQILEKILDEKGGSSRGSAAMFSIPLVATAFCSFQVVANNSRLLYAFARDRGVPVWKLGALLHPKTNAPMGATVYVMALIAALSAPMCFDKMMFTVVTSFAIQACYTGYALPIVCKLITGRRHFLPGPFHMRPRLSTINNMISAVWVVTVVGLSSLPGTLPVTAKNCNWSGPMLLSVVALLLAWYFFPRYGARKWFQGPRPNLGQFDDVLPSDLARRTANELLAQGDMDGATAEPPQQQQPPPHGVLQGLLQGVPEEDTGVSTSAVLAAAAATTPLAFEPWTSGPLTTADAGERRLLRLLTEKADLEEEEERPGARHSRGSGGRVRGGGGGNGVSAAGSRSSRLSLPLPANPALTVAVLRQGPLRTKAFGSSPSSTFILADDGEEREEGDCTQVGGQPPGRPFGRNGARLKDRGAQPMSLTVRGQAVIGGKSRTQRADEAPSNSWPDAEEGMGDMQGQGLRVVADVRGGRNSHSSGGGGGGVVSDSSTCNTTEHEEVEYPVRSSPGSNPSKQHQQHMVFGGLLWQLQDPYRNSGVPSSCGTPLRGGPAATASRGNDDCISSGSSTSRFPGQQLQCASGGGGGGAGGGAGGGTASLLGTESLDGRRSSPLANVNAIRRRVTGRHERRLSMNSQLLATPAASVAAAAAAVTPGLHRSSELRGVSLLGPFRTEPLWENADIVDDDGNNEDEDYHTNAAATQRRASRGLCSTSVTLPGHHRVRMQLRSRLISSPWWCREGEWGSLELAAAPSSPLLALAHQQRHRSGVSGSGFGHLGGGDMGEGYSSGPCALATAADVRLLVERRAAATAAAAAACGSGGGLASSAAGGSKQYGGKDERTSSVRRCSARAQGRSVSVVTMRTSIPGGAGGGAGSGGSGSAGYGISTMPLLGPSTTSLQESGAAYAVDVLRMP